MKKSLVLASLALLSIAGCATVTPVTVPVSTKEPLDIQDLSKSKKSSDWSLWGFGKATVFSAAKKGNIKNVKYAENYCNFLGYCDVTVYGD